MTQASLSVPSSYRLAARCGVVIALFACLSVPAAHAAGGGAATALYQAALVQERGLRAPGESPSLNDLRAIVAAYEAIVRRFPHSQYGDHALWQAAGLSLEAFDRYRAILDFEHSRRLLDTLEEMHPESPFAARADERRQQLNSLRELASLRRIERDVHNRGVRVTLHLDADVPFDSAHIEAPPRLFFDLRRTEASAELRNATLTYDDATLVREIRLGRHPSNTTRVVLDMADVDDYNVFALYDPFRLIIDCLTAGDDTTGPTPETPATAAIATAPSTPPRPAAPAPVLPDTPSRPGPTEGLIAVVDATIPDLEIPVFTREDYAFETAETLPERPALPSRATPRPDVVTPTPEIAAVDPGITFTSEPDVERAPVDPPHVTWPESNSSGTFSIARQLGLGVSRIVIDPGHGGHDPGARSGDLVEADLVLDIAQRLEQRLTSYPHFEVVLTRRTDEYVPLEARTTLARRVNADLFLSIHANASQRPQARGVETHFLNFTNDPDAEALAARENVAGVGKMGDLDQMVETIATSNKFEESHDFAQTVQRSLLNRLRRVDAGLPDLGVKQAPFVVLIGIDIPSALAEISFVTNDQDATLLSTETYRDLIADALLDGVLRYQLSLKPAPLVAWQTTARGS